MRKLWQNRTRRTRRRNPLAAVISVGACMALASVLHPTIAAADPGVAHAVTTRCVGDRGVIDISATNATNAPINVVYDVTELQSFPARTMAVDPLSQATASVTGRHDASYTVTLEYVGLERTEVVEVDCVSEGIPAAPEFSWTAEPSCEASGGMLSFTFSNGTLDPVDYTWDVTELQGFAPRAHTAAPQSVETHRVTGRHDATYTLTIEYNGLERTEQVEVDCVVEGIPASEDFEWTIHSTCEPSGGVLNLVFSNGTNAPIDYTWDVTELMAFAPRESTLTAQSLETHRVFGRHDRRYTVTIEYNGLERTEQVDVSCQA